MPVEHVVLVSGSNAVTDFRTPSIGQSPIEQDINRVRPHAESFASKIPGSKKETIQCFPFQPEGHLLGEDIREIKTRRVRDVLDLSDRGSTEAGPAHSMLVTVIVGLANPSSAPGELEFQGDIHPLGIFCRVDAGLDWARSRNIHQPKTNLQPFVTVGHIGPGLVVGELQFSTGVKKALVSIQCLLRVSFLAGEIWVQGVSENLVDSSQVVQVPQLTKTIRKETRCVGSPFPIGSLPGCGCACVQPRQIPVGGGERFPVLDFALRKARLPIQIDAREILSIDPTPGIDERPKDVIRNRRAETPDPLLNEDQDCRLLVPSQGAILTGGIPQFEFLFKTGPKFSARVLGWKWSPSHENREGPSCNHAPS